MKKSNLVLIAALTAFLSSCATPPPRQTYINKDNSALIVESLDDGSCQILAPRAGSREDADRALDQAKHLPKRQTAVVILENYSEPQLGHEFRERAVGWFVGLRGLGYQRIVFLKGNGATNPSGLPTLAEYD